MTTAPRHAIYAYLTTGVKVKVRDFATYDEALRNYHGCNLAAGQVPQTGDDRYVVGEYIGTVRSFSVRSTDDPGWPAGQPSHELSTVQAREWTEMVDFLCGPMRRHRARMEN